MRALLLLVALSVSGCAYTHSLDLSDPDRRQSLSERAARQTATVTVVGETPMPVRALSIGSDSTSWIDDATGERRVVSSHALGRVSFPRAERNPLTTLLVTTGLGIAGGAVLGYLAGTDEPTPGVLSFTPEEGAQYGALMYGTLGAIAGGAIALDSLNPRHYVVPSPARSGPVLR